jgi:acetamidase/formamidase
MVRTWISKVVAGVTMQFPVYEPGALFMLGDGHAAQGDGEIDGAAIETSFNVRFTVGLIKDKKIDWPHLINDKTPIQIRSATRQHRRHGGVSGGGKGRGQGL